MGESGPLPSQERHLGNLVMDRNVSLTVRRVTGPLHGVSCASPPHSSPLPLRTGLLLGGGGLRAVRNVF